MTTMAQALSKKRESERRKKLWDGGDVEDELSVNDHPHNSSGEPHTEGDEEEEKPMEFMADGGLVPPTTYTYQGGKPKEYGSIDITTFSKKPKKQSDSSDLGAPSGGSSLVGPDSSEERLAYCGMDARMDRAKKMLAGGEAKSRESAGKEPLPKMYGGGQPQPGIGRGGGLKGAFEHDDEVPPPPPPKAVKVEEDNPGYVAGGEAKLPERRDPQASPYGDTGGHYHDSEDDESLPEEEQEMPRMYAGGNAALAEERHDEADSLEDVDASFIEAFLRARKNKSAAPGR